MELVGRQRLELLVVDIRMPPKYSTEGLEAARVIKREFPQTVVVAAHVEVEHALDLLANGHRTGYLPKSHVTDMNIAEFVDTLRGWSAAGRWWTRRWCRNLLRRGGPAALRPDVVLIDIRLGEESGLQAAGRQLEAALIMISAHPGADYADLIADSPAAGFLG